MIKGWKNKPEWVKYYEERTEKRAKHLAQIRFASLNIELQNKAAVHNLDILEWRRVV